MRDGVTRRRCVIVGVGCDCAPTHRRVVKSFCDAMGNSFQFLRIITQTFTNVDFADLVLDLFTQKQKKKA